MKQYLCLVNPISGNRGGAAFEKRVKPVLQEVLGASRVDVIYTGGADCAAGLQQRAAACETLIVAGGDGTVFYAVNEIAGLADRPKLGIIPMGTGNDLARSLGILQCVSSRGVRALLEVIVQGATARVDVLGLNGRQRFINYCGIGADARISKAFNRTRAHAVVRSITGGGLNKLLYVVLGLRHSLYRIPFDIQMRYRTREGSSAMSIPRRMCQVLMSNIPFYAGGARPCSRSRLDDGLFEVTVIATLWQWILLHCTRFSRKPFNELCRNPIQFQTDSLELACAGTTSWQLDGETCTCGTGGSSAQKAQVATAAQLDIIVPHPDECAGSDRCG